MPWDTQPKYSFISLIHDILEKKSLKMCNNMNIMKSQDIWNLCMLKENYAFLKINIKELQKTVTDRWTKFIECIASRARTTSAQ